VLASLFLWLGKATKVDFTANFDGKGPSGNGNRSRRHGFGRTPGWQHASREHEEDGQTVMSVTSVVSTDGKVRTSTFVGKDKEGHDVKNVVVYDKE
jgi:hypothetical protein